MWNRLRRHFDCFGPLWLCVSAVAMALYLWQPFLDGVKERETERIQERDRQLDRLLAHPQPPVDERAKILVDNRNTRDDTLLN